MLDSFTFLNACIDEISTSCSSLTTLDANGMEAEPFWTKLVDVYQKFQTIETFHKPLKSRKHYFPTLKWSNPGFEEIIRTQASIFWKKTLQKN